MYTGTRRYWLTPVLLFAFVLHLTSSAHAQTIKAMTLEAGALTGATGADRVSGSVSLQTSGALKGGYSAHLANVSSAYLQEQFGATDAFYVSTYIRLNARPAKDVRLLLISNSGTTVGNIVLRSSGRLRLRQGSTAIGSESAALQVGQLYRIGVHQRRGTGRNAVIAAYVASGDQAFGSPFAATSTGSWTTAADRLRIGTTTSAAVNVTFDDVLLAAGSMPLPSSGTASPTPTEPTPTEPTPTEPTPTEPTPTEPAPTPSGTATVTLPVQQGIWIGQSELLALPTSGSAWASMKSKADTNLLGGVITNRDDNNTRVLAAALVAARLNDNTYRARVRDALVSLMGGRVNAEDGLALLRRLGTYTVAADLINLKSFDPTTDSRFRTWLQQMRAFRFSGGGGGGTLIEYHERRPNNFGTHAAFSRSVVARYLGDSADLARSALVFKGFLGDRSAYARFSFGDLAWQCDPTKPVGINPSTCQMENLDGVLPDDQRRAGGYTWPPPKENYVWEALQGALANAVVLRRAGYDVFNWENKALYRAVRWLHVYASFPAEGDDTWLPHIVNRFYGTSLPAPVPSSPGKNAGYTDWTLGK